MEYEDLSPEEFDAMATGEMAHHAIWLERELIGIISDYFVSEEKRYDFERLLMLREGLTFQDKIEIVQASIPLFPNSTASMELKDLLARIVEFKRIRNALAHGVADPDHIGDGLAVLLVSRSGALKVTKVTYKTHREQMASAEELLEDIQSVRARLLKERGS